MNETSIDLNSISLLATIHELGGYGKAADKLGVSVATVSRKITSLERSLGIKLLERNSRIVQLTSAGEELLHQMVSPLGQIEQALENLKYSTEAMSGVIRVATTATLAETLLSPVLLEANRLHSDLQFEILLDEDVIDIRKNRIDFAIRGGEIQDSTAYCRKLTTHRFSCWTTPQRVEGENVPLLSYHRSRLGDAAHACVIVRDVRILKGLVLKGMGEAWLPDSYCEEEERAGYLVRRTNREEFYFDIFALFPSNKHLTKRARMIINMLAER